MRIPDSLKRWLYDEPSGLLKKGRLIAAIVSVIFAIAVYLIQFTDLLAVKPAATLECESWRMPAFMEKELADPCIPAKYVIPNRVARLLKSQGMYHLFVENESGRTIKNARVAIPDAFYVEFRGYLKASRGTGKPKEATENPYGDSWKLGDIDNGYVFEVNAWTKDKASRELAGRIWINHESDNGRSTTPTIVGIWTKRYTFWTGLAGGALFVLSPLVIRKCEICRYFCDLAAQKYRSPLKAVTKKAKGGHT